VRLVRQCSQALDERRRNSPGGDTAGLVGDVAGANVVVGEAITVGEKGGAAVLISSTGTWERGGQKGWGAWNAAASGAGVGDGFRLRGALRVVA
jgi:3-oxoacyl-[acyl-carrier-protein] synthase III